MLLKYWFPKSLDKLLSVFEISSFFIIPKRNRLMKIPFYFWSKAWNSCLNQNNFCIKTNWALNRSKSVKPSRCQVTKSMEKDHRVFMFFDRMNNMSHEWNFNSIALLIHCLFEFLKEGLHHFIWVWYSGMLKVDVVKLFSEWFNLFWNKVKWIFLIIFKSKIGNWKDSLWPNVFEFSHREQASSNHHQSSDKIFEYWSNIRSL